MPFLHQAFGIHTTTDAQSVCLYETLCDVQVGAAGAACKPGQVSMESTRAHVLMLTELLPAMRLFDRFYDCWVLLASMRSVSITFRPTAQSWDVTQFTGTQMCVLLSERQEP